MEPGTILLVDDDPDIREFLGVYLETSGHAVTVATDGSEALEELERSVPDLIIADVKMPRMTGYDLCRRVREFGREEIPFIFCSALGSLTERLQGLRLGADDYVVKPVNAEELLLTRSSRGPVASSGSNTPPSTASRRSTGAWTAACSKAWLASTSTGACEARSEPGIACGSVPRSTASPAGSTTPPRR